MNCNLLLCYLSPEARHIWNELVSGGMDPDLAFAFVEGIGGEEVFDLNSDDGPEANE